MTGYDSQKTWDVKRFIASPSHQAGEVNTHHRHRIYVAAGSKQPSDVYESLSRLSGNLKRMLPFLEMLSSECCFAAVDIFKMNVNNVGQLSQSGVAKL